MEPAGKKDTRSRRLGQQAWAYYHGGGHDDWYGRRAQGEIGPALAPLLARLEGYDRLRLRLERQGGPISMLGDMGALIKAPIVWEEGAEKSSASLADPTALAQALCLIAWDLRLEVRIKPTRLPVYYLCRIRSDYWSEYSFVVEDFYLSPGYPLVDARFVKLMQGSHEQYFLRLSPFRQALQAMAVEGGESGPASIDEQLYRVGRHVLLAAWHQDQQVGMACARHFGLPKFAQAVELLYLCLSGELCELRGSVDSLLLRFFTEAYPQEAITRFLECLRDLEGAALHDLPRLALTLYARLSRAFSDFLGTTVNWSKRNGDTPLWKMVYGNLGRLELVANDLAGRPAFEQAVAALEGAAENVSRDLYAL